ALFVLAVEEGEGPCEPIVGIGGVAVDARHVVLGLAGGFVVIQAIYYAYYFVASPGLAVGTPVSPAIWLPALMLVVLAALSSHTWRIVRRPLVRDRGRGWAATRAIADRLLAMAPITTMRQ